MGKFKRIDTSIDGVCIVEPTVFGDNRGYFMETYSKADFEEIGLNYDFVQDNQSKSKKGVLRGLHFQKENTQAKLVRCIKGEVFDVAVDLRPGSKTYGKGSTWSAKGHYGILGVLNSPSAIICLINSLLNLLIKNTPY